MTSTLERAPPAWTPHYARGVPPSIEVPSLLLPQVLERSAREWPRRPALIFYGAAWSYARLWRESGALASALRAEGVGPGDRVALYLPNCPAYPIAFYGVLRAGATVVQVPPLYHGEDLRAILEDSHPRAVVTLEVLAPNLTAAGLPGSPPTTFVARLRAFYPPPQRWFVNVVLRRRGMPTHFPVGAEIRDWSRAVRGTAEPPAVEAHPATTVAVLQYTGGTTGLAKAAMLTHRNLVANILQCQAWFRGSEPGREVVLAAIPFFHSYGMTVALNYPLSIGAAVVLQLRPDATEMLRLIDRYRPTQVPGVPAFYQAINQHADLAKFHVRSIRFCLSGSAPLPVEVARRFESLTGGKLVEGYGLSEASPVTHANPIEGVRKEGSIGLPLPSTEQEIRDPETGARTLPVGETGELVIRGPQVMLGYYQRPDETARALRDGWLFTGDLARTDAEGYVYILDRKNDMINVGGLKVYPREVEEVLLSHPGVADAAVVGIPHPELGEVVRAFVVPKPLARPSAEELIEFVRARLAHYKAPRSVEFRTDLPRSGVQKVLRRVLRSEPEPARAPA